MGFSLSFSPVYLGIDMMRNAAVRQNRSDRQKECLKLIFLVETSFRDSSLNLHRNLIIKSNRYRLWNFFSSRIICRRKTRGKLNKPDFNDNYPREKRSDSHSQLPVNVQWCIKSTEITMPRVKSPEKLINLM